MKKLKRILAWIGILVLAGLYITTFIVGMFGHGSTRGLLMACVICTVLIPVLIYAFMLVARILDRSSESQVSSSEATTAPADNPRRSAPASSTKQTVSPAQQSIPEKQAVPEESAAPSAEKAAPSEEKAAPSEEKAAPSEEKADS